jgi:hypothetical protein
MSVLILDTGLALEVIKKGKIVWPNFDFIATP